MTQVKIVIGKGRLTMSKMLGRLTLTILLLLNTISFYKSHAQVQEPFKNINDFKQDALPREQTIQQTQPQHLYNNSNKFSSILQLIKKQQQQQNDNSHVAPSSSSSSPGKLLQQLFSSITTTPEPITTPTEPSLWDLIKKGFNQPGTNIVESSNSVLAPSGRGSHFLSSTWDWASKLGSNPSTHNDTSSAEQRTTRGVGGGLSWGSGYGKAPPTSTVDLAWDTAKLMGSVGKGLLNSWMGHPSVVDQVASPSGLFPVTNFKLGLQDAVNIKFRDYALAHFGFHENKLNSFRSSFLPLKQLMSGGAWSSPTYGGGLGKGVVVVHPEGLLFERLFKAKYSIMKALLLLKLRLTKDLLTSTLPNLINLQLNAINALLHLIQHKDLNHFFRAIRILNRALWKGKKNFWFTLLKLKDQEYFGQGWTPPNHSNYGVNANYGEPKPPPSYYGVSSSEPSSYSNYGQPNKPIQDYGVSSSKPWSSKLFPSRSTYGGGVSLGNPLTAYPTPSSSYNPSYGGGGGGGGDSSYDGGDYSKSPQIEYATLPPIVVHPQYSASASNSDKVTVSGKFLRDLIHQSTNNNKDSDSSDATPNTTANKFSSQLRLHSGFKAVK